MAFNPIYHAGVPRGRILPVYLADSGDVYPISFKSMEELELCGEMVAMIMQHKVVVDTCTPINTPAEKIRVLKNH